MAITTAASFLEAIRQFRLLEPEQQDELAALHTRFGDPRALARELMQRGWLTPYQVNHIFLGKGQELLLGSYVLLERLGEGGMGQVFKARNWKLGKIVALKLIRKDRLAKPEAVRRFQREVRAMAQLDHPHIVRAFDADEVGGTHLLVMEFVPGADLAQLVKQQGPLPVATACEFIRQAALGLQHAFERGLVHRDIKPHNLLVSIGQQRPMADGRSPPAVPGPTADIKILDMGLARLSGDDSDSSGTLTQEGSVMGTVDYISPEQAMNSHTADIRSDLYSLGCTLYFLLTGKVPFPGGELMQKLLKHRFDNPVPVEQLRPEIPVGARAVVRKLMAKRPDDRFQTPAELAQALGRVLQHPAENPCPVAAAPPAPPVAAQEEGKRGNSSTQVHKQWAAITADPPSRTESVSPDAAQPSRLMLAAAGGAILILIIIIGLIAIFTGKEPDKKEEDFFAHKKETLPLPPPPKKGPDQPPVAPSFSRWLATVAAWPAEKQVEAVAKKLQELNPNFLGKVISKIDNGVVTDIQFDTDFVTDISPLQALRGLQRLNCSGSKPWSGKLADLSPLRGLQLEYLNCANNLVADLSPLKGMPLGGLNCNATQVADLSPLQGMKLKYLGCERTQVSSLSPLQGAPLNALFFNGTRVKSLAPLEGMPLAFVDCQGTWVNDLSPLRAMPLRRLACNFNLWRDADIVRGFRGLETINGLPARGWWQTTNARLTMWHNWCQEVARLPAEEQVKVVVRKLQELNARFDGKVKSKIENNVVTELEFLSDGIIDLTPLRALTGLQTLLCNATAGRGYLADLWPLKDLKLTTLHCNATQVMDLAPLRNMQLSSLHCWFTPVADLAPLQGQPLKTLNIRGTRVANLSPLKGMKLTTLFCSQISPADWPVLQELPLTCLSFNFNLWRDLELLRSLKSLEEINGQPATRFVQEALRQRAAFNTWARAVASLSPPKQVEEVTRKLQEINPGFDGKLESQIVNGEVAVVHRVNAFNLVDLSPVRALPRLKVLSFTGTKVAEVWFLQGMALEHLHMGSSPVADLTPLRDLPLKGLSCPRTSVRDLSPLRNLPLETLDLAYTPVTDLSPLAGLPLKHLNLAFTSVTDLTPLTGMKINHLGIENNKVVGLGPLQSLPLKHLYCNLRTSEDRSLVRSLKTLENINGKPAAEFWKEMEARFPP